MKEIKLTKGMVAFVDDNDYEYLSQWKWQAHKGHNTFYAARTDYSTGKKVFIRMHKAILGCASDILIDHKDRNGLNNSRMNLRASTKTQNAQNSICRKNNKYGYKGVSLFKRTNKFIGQIMINGKRKYLGSHDTPEDAAHAYDREAKQYFGEFANLNFPDAIT